MAKKGKAKKKAVEKHDFSKPGALNAPYESEASEIVGRRSVASVSEAHLTRNKTTKERFIRLLNRYKAPFREKPKLSQGFNIYNGDSLSKIIEVIRGFAEKLGWKPKGLSDEGLEKQAEAIAEEISKKDARIAELEAEVKKEKADKEAYVNDINKKHEEELGQLRKDAQKIKNLENDLVSLKKLILEFDSKTQSEETIQKFLEGKKWFFGLNVVSAKPKARAGADDIFDFLLTYTDGSQKVLELKLPTEKILDNEGLLSAPVTKGLDQLINYLKQTITIAHSQMPEAEYIKEKKPRGILVIGRKSSEGVAEKIKSWNYALNWVEIKTYDNLIEDAEQAINQIKGATEGNAETK